MGRDMKLGLQLGYWGSGPPVGVPALVAEAERMGFDSIWTAEAYGSDALTPLAWWGSQTERLRLGTALCQLSARTPTAMAMAALTLDHLSGGRLVLGLGVSGPQVVEGWYGQPFPKPLARTREYVDIVRKVLARDAPVTNDGPHYPLPYPGGTGLGKPLKSIVHPLRREIPIILGAEGPKNVAQAAEIADGWFPIFFSPTAMKSSEAALAEGFARPTARRTAEDFEVIATADGHRRRHRGGGRRHPAVSGPLHRRHGGQGDELPLRRVRPHGLRGRAAKASRSSTSTAARTRRPRPCPPSWWRTWPSSARWRRCATTSRRGGSRSPPPCSSPATPPPSGRWPSWLLYGRPLRPGWTPGSGPVLRSLVGAPRPG